MKLAGLDIGTTGCKITVFDEEGLEVGRAYRSYGGSGLESAHEVDAEALMEAVFAVVREAASAHADIGAIGVTSFGETFVMTDAGGKPLHRAMLYTDPRGGAECASLTERVGGAHIAAITGLRPHEMYSLPKLMWMKRNRPEVYAAAKRVLLIQDYVVFRLTGRAQIDHTLASRTMGFDIRSRAWSGELFSAAGLDVGLMSEPVPTGTVAGPVTAAVAGETGLSPRAHVVSVSHDQPAAAVGAGVFSSDRAVDGAGTVECVSVVLDSLADFDLFYRGGFAVVPYVVPGKYLCYTLTYTGGALTRWCVDTLAKKEKELARERGLSVNELLEREAEGPTGLLVLPHFAGAGTPYMDPGARGAIVGLTTESTVADINLACMEGVAYEMLLNLQYLGETARPIQALFATGGGANSRVWLQMKADILNLPVVSLSTVNAGTVGSAMLTGVATGLFSSLEEAAGRMVRQKEVFRPRPEKHEAYLRHYERYRALYGALRPLM